MQKVCAYAPAALSFVFGVHRNSDMLQSGSTGVGCTIDRGVTATVRFGQKTEVFFNNQKIPFPTVATVISMLTDKAVTVQVTSELPLGVGFGLSGASSLATAYALNKLLDLKKTGLELVSIAHRAEIVNHTGLGSVTTQAIGGFLVKTTPGIAPQFSRLPFAGKMLYSLVFGQLDTVEILSNSKGTAKLNAAARTTLVAIQNERELTLPRLLDCSYAFSRNAGLLLPKLKTVIEAIKSTGGHATMHLLGDAVVSTDALAAEHDSTLYTVRIIRDQARLLPYI